MATQLTDRVESLRKFRGLPVPWVARWTGEVVTEVYTFLPVDDLNWAFPQIVRKDGTRDEGEFGVMWQQDGQDRSGEPDFGQLNTQRQVDCMTTPRCQVCGERIHRWQWLMPTWEAETLDKMPTTSTPPICNWCVNDAPQPLSAPGQARGGPGDGPGRSPGGRLRRAVGA